MRPTFEDLKAICLLSYSRSAFNEASEWLEQIGSVQDRIRYENRRHYEALVYAAVVTYCRPFTKSQLTPTERVIPLNDVSPPQHLAAAHENMLNLRDKVIGHKDAVPTKGYSSTPNMILLDRVDPGFQLHTTRLGEMEAEQRKAAKELCSYFLQHCEAKLRPLTRKYHAELMHYPEGSYELLITEPPNEWIRRHSRA
jgi:hypothetical protein